MARGIIGFLGEVSDKMGRLRWWGVVFGAGGFMWYTQNRLIVRIEYSELEGKRPEPRNRRGDDTVFGVVGGLELY